MHHLIRRSLRIAACAALGVVLGLGLTAAGAGCGNCDGAIRELVVRSADACHLEDCVEDGGVYHVGPDVSLRVVGDGPNEESEPLLSDSGVAADTFFLLDQDGQRVAATVGADAGGHACRRGVGFNLTPDEPLAPGTYTAVLLLDDLAWPLAGGAAVQRHEGKDAFVRQLEVVADANP
ncbi:Ig-like domain-containing protein [Nannocystis pusilla]|uniref:Ig-like domain-containing protein n=1 Tax=Nannocystis pusilla TaxID=889268 RepID=A0ABS7TR84_9BACT|nr:Ig-like domain-containing protein [Nannocystis pusilla]MBZ5710737.1 Ig-like domain-containing protein [Nannocystis pusilla]